MSRGRGGARFAVRDDDARGGARSNAGPPKSRWKNVLSDHARAALAVMGLQDAVKARIRQDEAEIKLVECLILEERDRRLAASDD